ncbi:MAG: shikimate dehydrogenase [Crocinitomix sp.]|nr:shikimate dehydrogenase [Crocinitomix sp.]
MENSQKKYGLIGKSLDHSFSKAYFTQKFQDKGINARYENIELEKIADVVAIFTQNFDGCNVTIPYKETIIPFLDELSAEASLVQAVNTIEFKNGKTIGHNTDVYGFKQMIKPFFKSHHERAMIIGTGGAAKAVAYVLEELGVNVIYISRNPQGDRQFSYSDINENMIKFNGIIINTTPIGMHPNVGELVELPYEFMNEKHLAIDLIYNPSETLFLKNAKAQGAWTLNGLTMLHQQAEKAWGIWNK